MMRRLGIGIAVILLAALGAWPVWAQRHFGGMRGYGARSGMHGAFRGHGARGHFGHSHFGYRGRGRYYNHAGFIAAPYFYPPEFYSDYYEEPPESEAPPTRVVVVQTSPPAPQAPPPPPPESLLLELHGDHWVRITDSGEEEVNLQTHQPGSRQTVSRRSAVSESSLHARPVPPAILVFRDGHQEQTARYTIIGPAIYTSPEHWAGGSWAQKIPLSELDVAATLRLNQERGVSFSFPTTPNEVVIRP